MRGNVDSHTAHLLRAYHIPGMIELDLSPDLEWEGQIGLMDGFDNKLYLDPDRELMEKLRLRYQGGAAPWAAGHRKKRKGAYTWSRRRREEVELYGLRPVQLSKPGEQYPNSV